NFEALNPSLKFLRVRDEKNFQCCWLIQFTTLTGQSSAPKTGQAVQYSGFSALNGGNPAPELYGADLLQQHHSSRDAEMSCRRPAHPEQGRDEQECEAGEVGSVQLQQPAHACAPALSE